MVRSALSHIGDLIAVSLMIPIVLVRFMSDHASFLVSSDLHNWLGECLPDHTQSLSCRGNNER
ncbi:MAG: hypothetical protein ACTH58_14600, partial [Marinomonas foliarum]|uniref:hypothetical protein n=1 Tax=Marinomonas foliarum TaxID=491950 RepID=UPI003F9A4633